MPSWMPPRPIRSRDTSQTAAVNSSLLAALPLLFELATCWCSVTPGVSCTYSPLTLHAQIQTHVRATLKSDWNSTNHLLSRTSISDNSSRRFNLPNRLSCERFPSPVMRHTYGRTALFHVRSEIGLRHMYEEHDHLDHGRASFPANHGYSRVPAIPPSLLLTTCPINCPCKCVWHVRFLFCFDVFMRVYRLCGTPCTHIMSYVRRFAPCKTRNSVERTRLCCGFTRGLCEGQFYFLMSRSGLVPLENLAERFKPRCCAPLREQAWIIYGLDDNYFDID